MNSASDGRTAKPHSKSSPKGSTDTNTETESNATGEVNRIAVMNNNDVIDTDSDDVIVKPVDVCSIRMMITFSFVVLLSHSCHHCLTV